MYLKKKKTLLDDIHRLAMVQIAVEEYPKLKASNIEFDLPQPNYTVNTLAYLEEKYPEAQFSLIMGEDNLKSLHKWKNYEVILDNHSLYVYPRKSGGKVENQFKDHPKITRVDAPVIEISATFIRDSIKEGKFIKPMLPAKVWEYVIHNNFYK